MNIFRYQNSFGNKDGPLYPLVEELDAHRLHSADRKKEIEELVGLMQQRVIAEIEYARKLLDISNGV